MQIFFYWKIPNLGKNKTKMAKARKECKTPISQMSSV